MTRQHRGAGEPATLLSGDRLAHSPRILFLHETPFDSPSRYALAMDDLVQEPDSAGDAAEQPPKRRAGRPRTVDRPKISRKRQIFEAATKVFAEKGYHAARVSDIAREAGVAHGLVYHYFSSKDEVLSRIFKHTWLQLEQGLSSIDASDATAAQKLADIVHLMFGIYPMAPDLVKVVILEVTRSGHLRAQVDEIAGAFMTIESIIRSGQESGEFRSDIDARISSYVFWGAIEEVVTGWVFGTLPSGEQDVTAAARAVVELMLGGMRATPSPSPGA